MTHWSVPYVCFHYFYVHVLPQEGDMPEEVNIDDLLDLPNEEERVKKLQVISPVAFIAVFSTSAWDEWTRCFVFLFIFDQINKAKKHKMH